MISSWQIKSAVRIIRAGGLVAYPTEAVYGLGCDPYHLEAVWRLIKLKRRALESGLILIASNLAQLQPFIERMDKATQDKVLATWPGPVTWLLPAHRSVSPLLRGRHHTIAVRITAHPIAAMLCNALGHALVSTSANFAEHRPARNTFEVRRTFGDRIDYLMPGRTGDQKHPSEIRDGLTDKIVRA